MPAKPQWIRHLRRLRALSEETTVNEIAIALGVGVRQAQKLTASVPARRIGTARLMRRENVLRALKGQAETLINSHEIDRVQAFREKLAQWNRDLAGPDRLPVSAPNSVVGTSISGLPDGVSLRPGYIEIEVDGKVDALQKMLALCFAIKNSEDDFESVISKR